MWLDDWLIGAFLLYGAWRAGRDAATGHASLAAAWGFTLAIAALVSVLRWRPPTR